MSLEKFLAACWCTPLDHLEPFHPATQVGLNVMLWSPPGGAKTAMVETVAAALGLYCHTIPASTVPPEDVAGVLVQDGMGGVKKATWEMEVKEMLEVGEGVIFFDELSTARQSNQAAFLTTFMKRKYGGEKLGPLVRLIAAGNPVDTSTGTFELSSAMANRLVHKVVDKVTEEQWLDYMAGRYRPDLDDLTDSSTRVKENWAKVWPTAYGNCAGFLRAKRNNLHAQPPLGSPDRNGAWPSLRTWQWTMLGIATARALGAGDIVEQDMINGLVGSSVGKELRTYITTADLPSAEDMLTKGWTPDAMRLDRSIAAYETLTLHVAGLKKGPKRTAAAGRAWELLLDASQCKVADILYGPCSTLINAGLGPSCGDDTVVKYSEPILTRFYRLKKLADSAMAALKGTKP